MDLGFDVELELDSADEIGKQIYRLYREWMQSIDGRQKVLRELKKYHIQKPIQVISVHHLRENLEVIWKYFFCFIYVQCVVKNTKL